MLNRKMYIRGNESEMRNERRRAREVDETRRVEVCVEMENNNQPAAKTHSATFSRGTR